MRQVQSAFRPHILIWLLAVLIASACGITAHAQDAGDSDFKTVSSESNSLLLAVKKIMGLVQDVTRRHAADPVARELEFFSGATSPGNGGLRTTRDELSTDELVDLLYTLRSEVRDVSRQLADKNEDLLMRRMDRIEETIDEALALARRQTGKAYAVSGRNYSGTTGNSGDNVRISVKNDTANIAADDEIQWYDADDSDWPDDFEDWKYRNRRWRSSSSSFAGDYTRSWPYAEQAVYRESSGVRYNRVEGLFLGLRRKPLDWNSYEQARIYGQGGYAFEQKEWSYEIGAEAKIGRSHKMQDFGFKFGGSYRRNTTTQDLWKSSWTENSLAAIFFGYDFFDYFQTEGWTTYAVSRLTPFFQLSAGYREDRYRSLQKNTSWALFGGDNFRPNPVIDDGKMNSIMLALDGGRVRGYVYRPDGVSFRLQAEFGTGLGGDFSFNSYQGDIRSFFKVSQNTGFDVRLRVGYTDGDVPIQKSFSIGGIGSVRAYPQNIFVGSRMMLANAEYTIYKQGFFDDVFDQLSIFGLFDAGWSNYDGKNAFEWDSVISAAGFGVAIDERVIRLELAWPMKDVGTGTQPSLWLRLNPTF